MFVEQSTSERKLFKGLGDCLKLSVTRSVKIFNVVWGERVLGEDVLESFKGTETLSVNAAEDLNVA